MKQLDYLVALINGADPETLASMGRNLSDLAEAEFGEGASFGPPVCWPETGSLASGIWLGWNEARWFVPLATLGLAAGKEPLLAFLTCAGAGDESLGDLGNGDWTVAMSIDERQAWKRLAGQLS